MTDHSFQARPVAKVRDDFQGVIPEEALDVKASDEVGVRLLVDHQAPAGVFLPGCERASSRSPGSSCSARSEARTNDLDAGEERRRLWDRKGVYVAVVILPVRCKTHMGRLQVSTSTRRRSGSAMPGIGCRSSLRRAEAAWSGAATARWAQSSWRPRHGGSHDTRRARTLAASGPAHPASAKQRISPSRRP